MTPLAMCFHTLAALVANVSNLSHVPVSRMTKLRFVAIPHGNVIWWWNDSGDWDECPIDIFYTQTLLEMMNLETD